MKVNGVGSKSGSVCLTTMIVPVRVLPSGRLVKVQAIVSPSSRSIAAVPFSMTVASKMSSLVQVIESSVQPAVGSWVRV